MARLEFVGKGASKFWEIRREGTHLHVTWGKIGTKGQSQVKSFPTDDAAESAMESLIAEKTKEGYREGAAAAASTPAPAATPAAAKVSARRVPVPAALTDAQRKVLSLSVDSLALDRDTRNELWTLKLPIVEDIVRLTARRLTSRGLSASSLASLERALAKHGLSLGTRVTPAPPPKPFGPARDPVAEIASALTSIPASFRWSARPGATMKQIKSVRSALGVHFPDDLVSILGRWNGLTLVDANATVEIYGTESLLLGQRALRDDWNETRLGAPTPEQAAFLYGRRRTHETELDHELCVAIVEDGSLMEYERDHLFLPTGRSYLDFLLDQIAMLGR